MPILSVSILVLVDAALRQGLPTTQDNNMKVSILVLVDAALRPRRRWRGTWEYQDVSILVLVDAALRRVLAVT